MYKTRLILILILLTNFNIFSQTESNQISVTDTINNLSNTNDVVDLFSISLTDDELSDDTSASDNISGLLNSSMDVFYRTAAYEFSSSFFKVRGLDSDNAIVQINGIKMNKLYNGRPQWSNWGGLNDVLRNQELSNGSIPLKYNFGGILGSNNINIRASEYGEGGRITYSSSNRSYANRMMASYNSGMLEKGWAYSLSIGRRWGNEGYQDASFYDSNSAFLSVQKIFNNKHSLNLATIYAPNRRGKVSPNTQEVYDLKGTKYNEYWGFHDGEKRNSRVKRVVEPIIILNHDWTISEVSSLETSIGYQFGEMGNSRLDYAGGANPSPAYYQDLPSYYLADSDDPDYEGAYLAQEQFVNNGQINWNRIYDANLTNNQSNLDAAYVLYEDRVDDRQLTINSAYSKEINENIKISSSFNYRNLVSDNFAQISDMLGGYTYSNIDSFDNLDYNLLSPNSVISQGEKFKYHYEMNVEEISLFSMIDFSFNKLELFIAANLTNTIYQRNGIFENEANAGNSSGMGDEISFDGYGVKAGITYKFSGKHILDFNSAYIQKAPSIRNTFTNSRVNHNIVGTDINGLINNTPITEEKVMSFDANYIFRTPIFTGRLTGFYSEVKDANEISFYYADGLVGFSENSEFVQEILQGIDKKYIGAEFGIEAQIIPTVKLKGAASIGQYTYANNPYLYLGADNTTVAVGPSNLENYKLAGGPQRAYSFGFEYRDPDYWFIGVTSNFFTNTYVDVSPLTRTQNFYLAQDGLPFNDYDISTARNLLRQEKFDNYMVVNMIGGKSWRIDDYYVGFFASINNILDKKYKTGGFEQGRNANYQQLLQDVNKPKRVFGPKYWYGRGTNYFLNLYFRF
ncbi:MAG: TonB-dependent receptor [Flavobacteriaceae bacterium]|nr:TonB-dependent receptor [Flavobacteriaceae bacterium]|tara:strand:+ start:22632 stop:25196 length:2565 start_codon:yes stop_codon:yes gene_type:complete